MNTGPLRPLEEVLLMAVPQMPSPQTTTVDEEVLPPIEWDETADYFDVGKASSAFAFVEPSAPILADLPSLLKPDKKPELFVLESIFHQGIPIFQNKSKESIIALHITLNKVQNKQELSQQDLSILAQYELSISKEGINLKGEVLSLQQVQNLSAHLELIQHSSQGVQSILAAASGVLGYTAALFDTASQVKSEVQEYQTVVNKSQKTLKKLEDLMGIREFFDLNFTLGGGLTISSEYLTPSEEIGLNSPDSLQPTLSKLKTILPEESPEFSIIEIQSQTTYIIDKKIVPVETFFHQLDFQIERTANTYQEQLESKKAYERDIPKLLDELIEHRKKAKAALQYYIHVRNREIPELSQDEKQMVQVLDQIVMAKTQKTFSMVEKVIDDSEQALFDGLNINLPPVPQERLNRLRNSRLEPIQINFEPQVSNQNKDFEEGNSIFSPLVAPMDELSKENTQLFREEEKYLITAQKQQMIEQTLENYYLESRFKQQREQADRDKLKIERTLYVQNEWVQ